MSCSSAFFVFAAAVNFLCVDCALIIVFRNQNLISRRREPHKNAIGQRKNIFHKIYRPAFVPCRCPDKHLFSATTFCRCKTSRKGQKTYEMCSGNSIRLFADTLPFFVSNQVRWLTIQKLAERFKIIPRHAFFFA